MLDDAESICVAAILQDSVDRLHVIGRLLPIPTSVFETGPISKASTVIIEKSELNAKASISRHELFPKNLTNEIQSKATFDDDLFKLQRDRTFLEEVLQKTLTEIKMSNSYTSLLEALESESAKNEQFDEVMQKEFQMKNRISNLQLLLTKTKSDTEELMKQCRESVAFLTDQLREAKVRTSLEERYVTTQSASSVYQSKKRMRTLERNVIDEIDYMKGNVDHESKINSEFENYIRHSLDTYEQKMEYWMSRHERETEHLDRATEILRANKQNDLERYRQILVMMAACKRELNNEKKEKEKILGVQEAEDTMLIKVIAIQAWWRGVMVRRGFGQFRKFAKMFKRAKFAV